MIEKGKVIIGEYSEEKSLSVRHGVEMVYNEGDKEAEEMVRKIKAMFGTTHSTVSRPKKTVENEVVTEQFVVCIKDKTNGRS